jgi:hypothetical protein
MTTPHDTGGPAFPGVEKVDYPSCSIETPYSGMSLRDYAAIHLPKDEGPSVHLAERLINRRLPQPANGKSPDPMELVLFWADAEAAYRFLLADAFIAARAKAAGGKG